LLAKLGAAWLFPPWHVIAAGMIPLAVLAYAARELAPVSRRSVVAQLAWGAVGTILPAMLIELAALVVLLVLAFWVMLIINPASLGQIRQLAETLTNTRSAGDPTEMLQVLIQNPPIAIASGLLVVGLVPLIEETFKGLGVAVFARSAPRASTALLWGLAAGAGFALTENLFNGSALTDLWAIGMLARGGTSLVHIAATGTVAVAWYAARVEHRYVRFALLFGIAVLAHTLWNLLTISLVGVSFFSAPAGNPLTLTLGELAALGFGLGLFALVVGGVVWIVVLVRWGMRWDRMGDQAIRNQAISDQESVTR
jgi:RsiW-degrading membrane proteinase PrsW (M82 family)